MLLPTVTLLVLWVTAVVSQTTHQVIVGADGTFYDPPTVSALQGDIVQFIFMGAAHTVTQSNATNPCEPLPGGFSSNISGAAFSNTGQPPVWNLIVEDVTKPIWYFCQLTQPSSHCATGMVGVINPPSIAAYESVHSAAKVVSGTPKPSLFLALSGIGAAATNSPTAPSSSISITVSVSASSSAPSESSVPPSSPPTSSAPDATTSSTATSMSHSKLGAIVGGAVGGAAVLVLLFSLVVCLRQRQAKQDAESTNQFFQYRVTPSSMQERSISKTAPSLSSSGTPGMLFPAPPRRNSLEGSTVSMSNGTSNVGVVVPPPEQYSSFRGPSAQVIPRQGSNQNLPGAVPMDGGRGYVGDMSQPYSISGRPSMASSSPIVSPRPLPVFPHPYSGANAGGRKPTKDQQGLTLLNPDYSRLSAGDSLERESPAPPLYRAGNT